MVNKLWPPQDQLFWSLNLESEPPCHGIIEAEVVVIGGGFAGLSAAHAFAQKGKKVILLEQYYCGSGASGKSSGFITADAELSLSDFANRYNLAAAQAIWNFFEHGVQYIEATIKKYQLECDYKKQDTLVVANRKKDLKELKENHNNLEKAGYKSFYYSKEQLKNYLETSHYYGALRYEDTFSINSYLYCQQMKKVLIEHGVKVFEQSPALHIDNHTITTPHAKITADYIIVCADRFIPMLGLLTQEVSQVQTFLMLSEQVSQDTIKSLYPENTYMVWDMELIYSYFRIAHGNRILLGGSTLWATYASQEYHNYMPIIKKLVNYFHTVFPQVKVQFEHIWPGLIGVSKDIGPIAGPDKKYPHIYYIGAAAGLPIAAALGNYSAQYYLESRRDLDEYFSPYRSFAINNTVQRVLGKTVSFALSHLISTS